MDLLNESEIDELETWIKSLDDCSSGMPTEMSVEQLERRLFQLFGNPFKASEDKEGPPYPLR
ncbi:hypothetical protein [Mucilaginibacter sp. BT774]|uniref:hypothetical protein n=1 Tax=Mucilaginibacter sp. BT774 TaxID=3062276 RepID=UPI00267529FB|nr:hypothetical protein [Mucilaginibacter sp. BT774]MDO3626790.1 hypothetical protein [Mucilaginibacter sp. BT774]